MVLSKELQALERMEDFLTHQQNYLSPQFHMVPWSPRDNISFKILLQKDLTTSFSPTLIPGFASLRYCPFGSDLLCSVMLESFLVYFTCSRVY